MSFDVLFLQIWNLKMVQEKPKHSRDINKDNLGKLHNRNCHQRVKTRKIYFYLKSNNGGDGNDGMFSEIFERQNFPSPSHNLPQAAKVVPVMLLDKK